MANTIILKKSSTASAVPAAASLQPGEVAVNLADQKLYSKTVGGTVIQVGFGNLTSGMVTTALGYTPYNSSNPSGYTSNTGTVTSVSGTGTVSGLTLTGTVTGSGSLTLGGSLSLTSGQVTTALGYTPFSSAGGTISGNVTLSAAKVVPNVSVTTSASTLTPNANSDTLAGFSALAAACTIAAPSGTASDGQKLIIRIKDSGTSQTLSWNAIYVAAGAALPTATTAGKWHHIGLIYNAATSTWMCIAATVQA